MASLTDDTATRRSLILTLATGLTCSGLLNVLLGVAVVLLATKTTQDWFVPPTGPGFLRPGVLADDYVQNEAKHMAFLQNNWTAETLPQVQQLFKQLLDPSLQKEYDTKTAPEERKVVKEAKIVLSQFVPTGSDILRAVGKRRKVLVHGIRTIYIGGTPDPQDVTIEIGLEPNISNSRPNGLKIMYLVPSHPLKIAGR